MPASAQLRVLLLAPARARLREPEADTGACRAKPGTPSLACLMRHFLLCCQNQYSTERTCVDRTVAHLGRVRACVCARVRVSSWLTVSGCVSRVCAARTTLRIHSRATLLLARLEGQTSGRSTGAGAGRPKRAGTAMADQHAGFERKLLLFLLVRHLARHVGVLRGRVAGERAGLRPSHTGGHSSTRAPRSRACAGCSNRHAC